MPARSHCSVRAVAAALLALPSLCLAQGPEQTAKASPSVASAARQSRYLGSDYLNYGALLPAPPAPGSQAASDDLAAVHRAEARRSPADVAAAQRDDREESIFAITPALESGTPTKLDPSQMPLLSALSKHLWWESGVIDPPLKELFNRPRPFVADPSLHPVCEKTASMSYPSGHSMVGYVEAFALAQMVPEHSAAILRRADEYARHRVVCGVHYPSDVEASHTAALALFGALSTSARFQLELAAAKTELRSKLGLRP